MKTVSIEQLGRVLAALPGTPRVVASGNFSAPNAVLRVLDAAIPTYRLNMLNAQRGVPDRDGVSYETTFIGPGMRGSPRLHYYPCRLSLAPHLFSQSLPPDVTIVHTSRPDGRSVSLGMEVNVLPAAIEATRARGGLVIAQANQAMPRTYGDALIPLSSVDYMVEVDEPLAVPPPHPSDETSVAIGVRVAALVPDGATLQLGIGGIPDSTLAALRDHRRLYVWSEMFSDGVLALEKAGCLAPDRPITASFCFGSAELHDWIDRNDRIRMLRSEQTNDPGLISRQPNLFAINSALQVDLFAQANASRVAGRAYSGFGGQTDFTVGALHSPGGHAIIALRSWHPKADVSTVVPMLTGQVTSFQHSYIITEQGTAPVWGCDEVTQAQNILDHAAHPAVRDDLRDAARQMGIPLH